MISMPYLPVAQITIAGLPLAFILGAVTLVSLLAAATLGMLLQKEGSDIQLTLHVNLARLTVVLALLHGLVVYLTFF
jgi:hypothetical protein